MKGAKTEPIDRRKKFGILQNILSKYKNSITTILALFVATAILFLEVWEIQKNKNANIMTVSFFDVGQADALLITSPNQKRVMIDTGLNQAVISKLSKEMNYLDKTIDLVISTHGHADHVGGLPSIIDQYKLKYHASNFLDDKTDLVLRIEDLIEEEQINQITLQAGDRVVLDKENNIYIDILWPTEIISINDKNDNSIVALLVFDEVSFLMTGDAGMRIENYLIDEFQEKLASKVLKLGHHGSRTSTALSFLEEVGPKYVVISAGENNRHGHPHEEVLLNLERYSRDLISNCEKEENNDKVDFCKNKLSSDWIQSTTAGDISFQTNGREIWLLE